MLDVHTAASNHMVDAAIYEYIHVEMLYVMTIYSLLCDVDK